MVHDNGDRNEMFSWQRRLINSGTLFQLATREYKDLHVEDGNFILRRLTCVIDSPQAAKDSLLLVRLERVQRWW